MTSKKRLEKDLYLPHSKCNFFAIISANNDSEKTINKLPDELLPAISKFLFVAKDEAEQSSVNIKNVAQMKEIVQCLVKKFNRDAVRV